jgi:Bacterial PH domain
MPAVTDHVTARPVRTARVAVVAGLVVFSVFLVVAFVMRRANAGVQFHTSDQVGTAVIGVLAGFGFAPFTRPRLDADAHGVRIRGFFGSWRTIPWEIVVAVEFPKTVRFARLVLPGDETVALYAVQRADRERSIAVMRGLRALHAQAHGLPV